MGFVKLETRSYVYMYCVHNIVLSCGRRLRSQEAAIGVAERAWACAGALPDCAPAAAALAALVEDLADVSNPTGLLLRSTKFKLRTLYNTTHLYKYL